MGGGIAVEAAQRSVEEQELHLMRKLERLFQMLMMLQKLLLLRNNWLRTQPLLGPGFEGQKPSNNNFSDSTDAFRYE